MYVASNTITVPNPQSMVEMFKQAAPHMKSLPGFLVLEIWTTESSIKAITKWENEESFKSYLQSDFFKNSHGGKHGDDMKGKALVETFHGEVLA